MYACMHANVYEYTYVLNALGIMHLNVLVNVLKPDLGRPVGPVRS